MDMYVPSNPSNQGQVTIHVANLNQPAGPKKTAMRDMSVCPLTCLIPFMTPSEVNFLAQTSTFWKDKLITDMTKQRYPFLQGNLSHLMACYLRNQLFDTSRLRAGKSNMLLKPIHRDSLLGDINLIEIIFMLRVKVVPFSSVRHLYWNPSCKEKHVKTQRNYSNPDGFTNRFPLEAFKALESLTIFYEAPNAFTQVAFLPNTLRVLQFSYTDTQAPQRVDCRLVSSLAALQTLAFQNCDMTDVDWRVFTELTQLKEMTFSKCENICLPTLASLPALMYLNFNGCVKLQNIVTLEKLNKLKGLIIDNCGIEGDEFFDLNTLSELRYLHIDDELINIQQFSTFTALKKLEELNLSSIGSDFTNLWQDFPALQCIGTERRYRLKEHVRRPNGNLEYEKSTGRQFEETAKHIHAIATPFSSSSTALRDSTQAIIGMPKSIILQ